MIVNIPYSIAQISSICQAKMVFSNPLLPEPRYLLLDSRKIHSPDETIFFALGNNSEKTFRFISELYEKGVRHFLTSEELPSHMQLDGANLLQVNNSLTALHNLAIFHRQHIYTQVIGITGSNGKTVVKEWLHYLLAEEYVIARSPGSFNSQIGVPLSILNMQQVHSLGIFEAGISLPGEMDKLEKIIQPDIGILTNIGTAHAEGFISLKQKLQEKLTLFRKTPLLVYCEDDEEIGNELQDFKKEHPHIDFFTWGKDEKANVSITTIAKKDIIEDKAITFIEGQFENNTFAINIPFQDQASVENALHCLCVIFYLKKATPEVLKRFETLEPVAMRLELKPAVNHCTLINDSYSNDLQSLRIALDFLSQQKNHSGKTVIFSDIEQSGIPPAQLYKQMASLIQVHAINKLIGIGPEIQRHVAAFSCIENASFFKSTDDYLKQIQLHHFRNESILIKGARKFLFEKVSRLLETKVHQTVLSVNLNHLVHNFKVYKQKLQPGTKLMVMVKASGYGSGSHEIASVLEYNKADYLAVAYTDEGIELRNAGVTVPIMVMNIDESTFDLIVNNNLQPEIFSFKILNAFLEYLKANDIEDYPIHIKTDTGMHRLGFMEDEMPYLGNLLAQNKYIKIKSVFSHLAASDEEANNDFTQAQFQIFNHCTGELEKSLGYHFLKHIANTSAISRFPEMQLDMVRLGIGLYGIDSNSAMQAELKHVSTLKTTISQIKKIPAGETVGYGRHGKLIRDSLIATVRIGYADGYPRILGNGKGKMLIGNQLVPVIGNVCMDMTMLDITDLNDVREGDGVIVFGETPTLSMLAAWADTIPYEMMTGISQRVKRVYFEE